MYSCNIYLQEHISTTWTNSNNLRHSICYEIIIYWNLKFKIIETELNVEVNSGLYTMILLLNSSIKVLRINSQLFILLYNNNYLIDFNQQLKNEVTKNYLLGSI